VASEILGFSLERTADEDIVCVTENDACGVDCIQCMLSCTVGKGNMILRPRGKAAFSFFDRKTGKKVRLVLKVPKDRFETKEESIDFILNAPVEEVFDVKTPNFDLPERARIFGNRTCECCGESAREDMVRFQEGKVVCLDCFKQYGRGWM
ncbi:MAG: FmdE family protein, partial [Candidatus Methanomethylophilaceae archaeon]